jgi:hypothetical protein
MLVAAEIETFSKANAVMPNPNCVPEWFEHGIRACKALPHSRERKRLLRQLTEAHLAINHGIHIYRDGCDIKAEAIIKSDIPLTTSAQTLIEKSDCLTGCDLDHVIEIQDIAKEIMIRSDADAIRYGPPTTKSSDPTSSSRLSRRQF